MGCLVRGIPRVKVDADPGIVRRVEEQAPLFGDLVDKYLIQKFS